MRISYSEDQLLIIDSVKRFCKREIVPFSSVWDENEFFPKELFVKFGQLGLLGIHFPAVYGGSNLKYSDFVSAIIEISKVDPSIGLSFAAHCCLCPSHILSFGNDIQKNFYLPNIISGRFLGAWALTEPNNGSDVRNLQTTAVLKGDHFFLNGAKTFITHGISCNFAIVFARTLIDNVDSGVSAFIVDREIPGFQPGKKIRKLGMRASETSEIFFQECKVPKDSLIGKVGEGFSQALSVLEGGRISIAALSVGISEGAYEASLVYSKERFQFGRPISKFQGISFKLASMYSKIQASKLLTYKSANDKDNFKEIGLSSSVSKYLASEYCVEIASDAVQIFGGNGYTKDFPVEKFYRDSKLCTIGEGTSEILQSVIAKEILK